MHLADAIHFCGCDPIQRYDRCHPKRERRLTLPQPSVSPPTETRVVLRPERHDAALEGWSWYDCFYFSTTSAFTIGVGDFTPTSLLSKLIWCGWSVYSTAAVGLSAALIGSWMTDRIAPAATARHSSLTKGGGTLA